MFSESRSGFETINHWAKLIVPEHKKSRFSPKRDFLLGSEGLASTV